MRKILFMLAMVLPIKAEAQSLGCYIDSGTLNAYGGAFLCDLSVAHPVLSTCGGNFAKDVAAFGNSMAEACEEEFNNRLQKAAELDDALNGQAYYFANWSACGNTNDQIRGAIGYWEGLTHYYEGLTARLRSKCGSKCKKVN